MLKIKAIKLFLLLSVFIFSIVTLVGCYNPIENDNVKATYVETSYKENIDEGKVNIVNNYLDLVALLEENIPEKYNDLFFENNSLLIFRINESSKDNRSKIESYEINDKILNIYVKTKQSSDDCMVACWWHILELSKNEIGNINGTIIFKNGEEIMNDDNQIIIDYIKYAISEGETGLNISNVKILENYGEYNGAIIVRMNRATYQVITYVSFIEFDIQIKFSDTNTPLVYKDGNFYELREAYQNGTLTKENIIELQEKIKKDNILKDFDLTDEKIIWNGDINSSYILDDSIIVTLKKTTTYPELDLSFFGLDNAISMDYLDGITIPNNLSNPENWRQKIIIYLKPEGKEKLLETIRKLEKLEFVKRVNPNWVIEGT